MTEKMDEAAAKAASDAEAEAAEAARVKAEPKAKAENEVSVVTTAIGAFGPEGLAPVGTKRDIPTAAFSSQWMRPATMGDRNKLVKAGKIEKAK